jgi:hypothetical protein
MSPRVATRELNAQSLAYWRAHPVESIETCLINPETGEPFELLPAEREFLEHAFTIGPNVLTLSSAQNAPALTAMALRGMRTAMGGSPNRRVGMLSGRPERMPEFGQRSRRVLTFE